MDQIDQIIADIAAYVAGPVVENADAVSTARMCLMDSLGCAAAATHFPACKRLMGPIVSETEVTNGARVPFTGFVLDPVKAAFDTGIAIRWLDYNDTWLAAEWGHPSDNFGAILATSDHLSRVRVASGLEPITMRRVLDSAVKAYEVQGVLSLDNAFNRVGIDHVLLVKVASSAIATKLLGGTEQQIAFAISQAFLEATLRTYRHAPNTGSRKSWAAGDATSRGVRLALMTLDGEKGYPTALSAASWGFQTTWFGGRDVTLNRPLGAYVIENILFKVTFPVEFHAQTAVEAALTLHPEARCRLDEIERITIGTNSPALRIIDKKGSLMNPADRDHCIQYAVAVALIFGDLTADSYEDVFAADPRIDALRARMVVSEIPDYSRDYLDPEKRSIANALQLHFKDGTSTARVEVIYPLGHRRRRGEALPRLRQKFISNLDGVLPRDRVDVVIDLFDDYSKFDRMPVNEFIDLLVQSGDQS